MAPRGAFPYTALPTSGFRPSAGEARAIWQRLEAWLVAALVALVRALPPTAASNIGGAVARAVGPRLPVSRVAHRNLARALPSLDAAARARVVRGVWDNVGRTAAELPHLPRLRRRVPVGSGAIGVEFENDVRLAALLASGGPAILFSAHIANWEILLPFASEVGLAVSGLYRAASNQAVDRLIQEARARAMLPGTWLFPKGASGARAALAHLARGGILALLVDQKMNDGIEAPFFGRPAMTASALAAFALRFRCPVIPSRVLRLGPARFRVEWEPNLVLPDSGDHAADVATLTAEVNAVVERWVRATPASWLWLHRRWKEP